MNFAKVFCRASFTRHRSDDALNEAAIDRLIEALSSFRPTASEFVFCLLTDFTDAAVEQLPEDMAGRRRRGERWAQ